MATPKQPQAETQQGLIEQQADQGIGSKLVEILAANAEDPRFASILSELGSTGWNADTLAIITQGLLLREMMSPKCSTSRCVALLSEARKLQQTFNLSTAEAVTIELTGLPDLEHMETDLDVVAS